MLSYDTEYFKLEREETRKARKAHRCSECYRQILPGETYNWFTGYIDGGFDVYKTCQHCQVAKEWLNKQCSGYNFTEVQEDITQHFYNGHGITVGRIAVGMRRKWEKFNSSELMPLPKMPNITEEKHGI
ncbi:MAG TPA: hypothetical protein PLP33_30335 [Leptospiraceae bacterium]|nr:hypothetical protein [Leptospiraceae bacterium]